MKNVTIAIDDQTHRAARLYAAEHGTSISALVKGYLGQLAATAPAQMSAPSLGTGVRESQANFTALPVSPTPSLLGSEAASGLPWLMNDRLMWTVDGKPRQPGALRAAVAAADAELGDFPAEMLASLAEWDEDAFDPLP